LLLSDPAAAAMPVIDKVAAANAIKQLAEAVATVRQLTSIDGAIQLGAKQLGVSVSPDTMALVNNTRELQREVSMTHGAVMGVPYEIERHMDVLMPPEGGWQAMTLEDMMYRVERLNSMTRGNASSVFETEAIRIEERIKRMKQVERATELAQDAPGQLSATQAQAQQLHLIAASLHTLEQMQGEQNMMTAQRQIAEDDHRQWTTELRRRDREERYKLARSGPDTQSVLDVWR